MLITIKEYANRNGLNHGNVRHKCQRGSYKTAQKIGRDWLIDENEPDVDRRVKTGEYKNWRQNEKDKRDTVRRLYRDGDRQSEGKEA